MKKFGFAILFLFSFSPWVRSESALAMGLFWAFVFGNPFPASLTKKVQTWLLQGSVVGLGFSVPILTVLNVGASSLGVTAVSIIATFGVGVVLARWISISEKTQVLVSSGTAICGGSAIAAVGPAIGAASSEMSMSLAVVFILNSVGLLVFPVLGELAGLTQHQFGLWAALSIHDTSSVVGAAKSFGEEALRTATTVKLVRALWILPLTLILGLYFRQKKKTDGIGSSMAAFPWFILGFLTASLVSSLLPDGAPIWSRVAALARHGMVASIFLVGASLNREAVKKSGKSVIVYGVLLWVLVALAAFFYVRSAGNLS